MAESKEHRRFRILRLGYKYLSHGEEIFAGAGLLAVTVVVFMNVLTRYFLSFSFSWAEEITRYIMVAVAFIGAAICSRRGIHLAIDFFFNILPKRICKVLAIAISLVGAAFTFRLTLLSLKYWQHALETGQKSAAMNVPMIIVYGPICVGCGLMCLHLGIAALKHGLEKEAVLKASEKGG
jgi:C4-dicarboxylate transporter DctQ subunit